MFGHDLYWMWKMQSWILFLKSLQNSYLTVMYTDRSVEKILYSWYVLLGLW